MKRCAACGLFAAASEPVCGCGGQLFAHELTPLDVADYNAMRVMIARIEAYLANTREPNDVVLGLFRDASQQLRRVIGVEHG